MATGGTLGVSGAISDFNGGYVLTKAGGGTLNLTGATTYTGGTAINGGVISINATSVGAINAGPLTLSGGGRLTISSVNPSSASQVSVGSGGGLISASGNNSFTTTGKLTGSGTLTLVDPGGAGGKTFNFNSLENDFTGGIIVSGAAGIALNINSLADSANNIAFTAASGAATISYGSGAIAPLSLSTRAIEINSAGALTGTIQNNNTSQAISIGGNLVATGAGTKILGLGAVAGPSNVYSGTITNGSGGGTIGVTKTGVGDWSITNASNTFTGTIAVNAGTLAYASAGGANGISFTNTNGSATLTYIGAAKEMSGAINAGTVTSGTVNLVASGSGAVNYSNTASLGSTGALVKKLVLSGTNAGDNILAGAWVNNGAGAATLTKNGAGKWILSGSNTYTGATTVAAGTLAVNGSLLNTATTVQHGAILQGSGTIGGSVTIQFGGTLAPGNSIESIGTGTLNLNTGSTFAYEINSNAAATVAGDLTYVTGDLNLATLSGSLLSISELGTPGAWSVGEKLTLISYTGAWNNNLFTYLGGTLADDSNFTLNGVEWTFNYDDTFEGTNYTTDSSGSFVTMTVAIPEPGAALIGSLGLLALLRRRRS